jgi:methylenetetrahydrofolate--tRNA-(uracil-5-)-methyltransferase
VPAGGALAVDREAFAGRDGALRAHPLIEIAREEIALPPEMGQRHRRDRPPHLAGARRAIRALTGEDSLAFFDAIAPIVHRDSIDMSVAWFQSRYDKAGPGGSGADYVNCPMTREQYAAFVEALVAGDKIAFHEWEGLHALFRWLPADRGDGGARTRDACAMDQ